nr:MAG TPA: hypothetical protein [Caudoviricetes sp.]
MYPKIYKIENNKSQLKINFLAGFYYIFLEKIYLKIIKWYDIVFLQM